ncbi:MAG: nucleoside deaminase [Bacilli bacterium]|nr:nucleoside deaminase [Bacilli bacterium]
MNEYMKIANDLSKDNLKTNNGGPFGACIVKNGEIIGKGSNEVIKTNDPTAHAEIIAIRDACANINSYDLSDCEIYTTCFPCPMCLSAIIWANIKKVYYGNTKEDANNIGFRDDIIYNYINKISNNEMDNKTINLECIDREETIKVFNEYMKKEDKKIY